jgi:hypothetical protein
MHDRELVQRSARTPAVTIDRTPRDIDGYQHIFMVAQVVAAIGPTIAARLQGRGTGRQGDGAHTMRRW